MVSPSRTYTRVNELWSICRPMECGLCICRTSHWEASFQGENGGDHIISEPLLFWLYIFFYLNSWKKPLLNIRQRHLLDESAIWEERVDSTGTKRHEEKNIWQGLLGWSNTFSLCLLDHFILKCMYAPSKRWHICILNWSKSPHKFHINFRNLSVTI